MPYTMSLWVQKSLVKSIHLPFKSKQDLQWNLSLLKNIKLVEIYSPENSAMIFFRKAVSLYEWRSCLKWLRAHWSCSASGTAWLDHLRHSVFVGQNAAWGTFLKPGGRVSTMCSKPVGWKGASLSLLTARGYWWAGLKWCRICLRRLKGSTGENANKKDLRGNKKNFSTNMAKGKHLRAVRKNFMANGAWLITNIATRFRQDRVQD